MRLIYLLKGIDRLRIDKFYNLVRCFLIQGLHHVKNAGKKSDGVNIFVNILTNLPLNEENSLSILLHLVDYYMADVIATGFSRTAAETLMAPMIDLLGSAKNPVIVQRLYVSVVEKLLDDNALGLDLGKIGEKCFDMGSDPSCLAKNRKILYQISKLFAEKKQEKKRDPPQKKQKIRIQSQNLEPMAPVVQVQEGEEKSKKKGLKRQKSVSFDFEKNQVREFDRMKSPSVFNDVKKSKKKSRRESL